MALPLPKVIPDTEAGGNIATALMGLNRISDLRSQTENRNSITQGQNIENKYLPEKLQQANAFAKLQNQYYAPNIMSEIGLRNAQTNKYNTMTPLEAEELRLKNKYYPDLTQAQIQNYQMGGRGGLGVGAKDDLLFNRSLSSDNPNFSQQDIAQANDIVSQGGTTMPDGRPINVTAATKRALDRAIKSTTTASLITQGTRANQAEAELEVLNDFAQKGLEPYGDTILGMNPQQVVDSFKKDPESQIRLGRFVASQALQYEAAQNRIRLANGQPGVTSTEGLMKASGQTVKAHYPQLSYAARKEAARYLDEALSKGLEARRSVGLGASNLQNKPANKTKETAKPIKFTRDASGKLVRA